MLDQDRALVAHLVNEQILARTKSSELRLNVPLSHTLLAEGPLFVLGATVETDLLSVSVNGLKRVDGPSGLGDFHYLPVHFEGSGKLGEAQTRLMEFYALLLSRLQDRWPDKGIIY